MDRQTAADLLDNLLGMVEDTQENDYDAALKMGIEALKADEQILSRLLAELTHKERTDRYHVWTTSEVKQWIADKITEMKNDG